MIDIRPVSSVLGILITLLGTMMLIPAMADLLSGSSDWQAFTAASALSIFLGVALWSSGRGGKITKFTVRQAFLLTGLSWAVLAAFGALPFIWAGVGLSPAAAYFEAVSGLTTTGSTVIAGLDTLPPGILIWRALLHFYGGIGIIVVAIGILPMLRVGGMQLFRTESSDKSEKIFPAAAQLANSILGIYIVLNLACAVAYAFAGMTPFDAVLHAMATISTGGFSTHDASIGYFNSAAIEWIAIVFMISGSLPFILYVQFLRGRPLALWNDPQVRLFVMMIAASAALLWLYQEWAGLAYGQQAFRHAIFNVVTLMSTTGFATVDYATWGTFATCLLFVVMFFGGCTGSTSGGLKMFRILLLTRSLGHQMKRMIYPSAIFPLTYQGRHIDDDVAQSVFSFFVLYTTLFCLTSVLLSATGLDFITAVSGATTLVANVGPGLGPKIGPAGNFSGFSSAALWIGSVVMLIGRLEIFTVLVLLMPRFWKA